MWCKICNTEINKIYPPYLCFKCLMKCIETTKIKKGLKS